jgi:hypothetical protein
VGLPVAVALLAGAGCGDDDKDDEPFEHLADSAGARGVAEALRVSLGAQDLNEDQHVDDVAVIREAVDDLPGDPEVAGVEDGDGDGRDDDGKIEVRVNDEVACVTVHDNGEVDVANDPC